PRTIDAAGAALADAIVGRIAVLDATGKLVECNASWERFAARTPGFPAGSLIAGESFIAAWERLAAAGRPYGREILVGLVAVLQGSLPFFVHDFPFGSVDGPMLFTLIASPLSGPAGGAVVSV